MKKPTEILIVLSCSLLIVIKLSAQDSITDYDGNVYHTITIGNQVWLKENLKSLHYSDGTLIPGVVAYNNSDSLAEIYGRLYPWNAAMKNSTTPGSQGVCPDGWHVPTHNQWSVMDYFLGGPLVAGGELKEAGTSHWFPPNTGATNSSGFTALPAGEYDANQSMNFLFMGQAAVFWTSNQAGSLMATERYLSHDNTVSGNLNWYKTMKYSIRCLKDEGVGMHFSPDEKQQDIKVSNPIENTLTIVCKNIIPVRVIIYALTGQKMTEKNLSDGSGLFSVDTGWLPQGVYVIEVYVIDNVLNGNPPGNSLTKSVFKCMKCN